MKLPPQIIEFITRSEILDIQLHHGFRGAIVLRFLHKNCPQIIPTHHTITFRLSQPELIDLTIRNSCGVFMAEHRIKFLTEEE